MCISFTCFTLVGFLSFLSFFFCLRDGDSANTKCIKSHKVTFCNYLNQDMDFYQTKTLARSGSQLLCSPGYGGPLSSGPICVYGKTLETGMMANDFGLRNREKREGGGGACVCAKLSAFWTDFYSIFFFL